MCSIHTSLTKWVYGIKVIIHDCHSCDSGSISRYTRQYGVSSSMVEHKFVTLVVMGSNPIYHPNECFDRTVTVLVCKTGCLSGTNWFDSNNTHHMRISSKSRAWDCKSQSVGALPTILSNKITFIMNLKIAEVCECLKLT